MMESAKSSEFMISEIKFGKSKLSKERVVTISLLTIAFIFMIVGIVLMAVAASEKKVDKEYASPSSSVKQVGKECASPSSSSNQEGQVRSTPTAITKALTTMAPPSRCGFNRRSSKRRSCRISRSREVDLLQTSSLRRSC